MGTAETVVRGVIAASKRAVSNRAGEVRRNVDIGYRRETKRFNSIGLRIYPFSLYSRMGHVVLRGENVVEFRPERRSFSNGTSYDSDFKKSSSMRADNAYCFALRFLIFFCISVFFQFIQHTPSITAHLSTFFPFFGSHEVDVMNI